MDVLLIGIDAACRGVLKPLFADDRLPTLSSLLADGVEAPLESHVPPWTPAMWPSIYTGVNPGKHGVFSFLQYEGYDWDVISADRVREHALWELLDYHDETSVVVNVPVTHPPSSFDGALLPGYTAPESPDCHPPGLLDAVTEAIGSYQLYPDRDDTGGPDAYTELVGQRGAAFRYLTEDYDPSFGFLQFQTTDTVFHDHPGEHALVKAIYERVDTEIERTLEQCDPDTVFVVSDHGIGEYTGVGFRMNTFLEQHGYVEPTESGAGMPSWAPIRDGRLRSGGDDSTAGPDLLTHLGATLSRVGITTRRVGRLLDRAGLTDTVASIVPDGLVRAGQRQIDFSASTAFMRARIELGVRINLEGRDPDGVVAPAEYDAVRSSLIELLSGVQTPGGEPVFERVAPREEFFDGPYAEEAVDIVTIPNEYNHFLTADLLAEPFGPPGQPWNHKREGLFIATGTAIEGTHREPHLFDVAPTVLSALEIPPSDRMDGAVLPIVEPVAPQSYPPYETDESETSRGDGAVADRLATLGYLDST